MGEVYFAYGSKYGAGPPTSDAVTGMTFEFMESTDTPANRNNSITREYDADKESVFKEHILVTGDSTDMAFSPNATNIALSKRRAGQESFKRYTHNNTTKNKNGTQ